MAETQETTNEQAQVSEGTLIGLAFLGGSGIIAITIALGIGVVVPSIDGGVIGLIVTLGFGLMAMGIGGWVFATKPYQNFDDINVPMYHGHHHDDDHDEHPTESVTEEDLPDDVINQPGEINVDEPRDEIESRKPIE